MLRSGLATLLAFLLFIIIHWLDFHYFYPVDRVNHILITAGIGIICLLFIYYILPKDEWFQKKLHLTAARMTRWVYPMFGILFFGFLFLGYLEFYFTAERSITFRMLMLTNKQRHHQMTREQYFARYDVPGIINKRLDDLVYGGYLEKHGSQYQITPKGYLTLSIYKIAITWLHLGTGEKAQ